MNILRPNKQRELIDKGTHNGDVDEAQQGKRDMPEVF